MACTIPRSSLSNVESFCSCGLSIRELYDITFVLFCSFNWNQTAPNPIREASTVMKNGCFVFGIVSSVSEVRDILSFWKRLSCSSVHFQGVFSCKRF